MNETPKYVVSSTLEEPLRWNNSTLLRGDVARAVTGLKQQPGGNIVVLGSGQLVRHLVRHDLVDELSPMIDPLVLGSGMRLFEPRRRAREPAAGRLPSHDHWGGHATFGCGLTEDAAGQIASHARRDLIGDWRDPSHVARWADHVTGTIAWDLEGRRKAMAPPTRQEIS